MEGDDFQRLFVMMRNLIMFKVPYMKDNMNMS